MTRRGREGGLSGASAVRASVALLVVMLWACAYEPPPLEPEIQPRMVNGDLELGVPGGAPEAWVLSKWSWDRGYRFELTADYPNGGERCALVRGREGQTEGLGTVLQWIDASPFRGKRVRFVAAARAEVSGPDNFAQLWFRADDGQAVVSEPPIFDSGWHRYEVVGDVPENASSIKAGVLLTGWGKAWLDDASLEIVGDIGADG